jgi:hypothetical protein
MKRNAVTTVKKGKILDSARLLSYFFSNEFSVLQKDQYELLRAILRAPGEHTKSGPGQYEVPLGTNLSKILQRYLSLCEFNKTTLNGEEIPGIEEIKRIRIQETGISNVGNTSNVYEKLEKDHARFLICFQEETKFVFINVNISKNTSVTLPISRSFATVVPEALSQITLNSSNMVGHKPQGNSFVVIIDCKIHNNIISRIAGNMMMASPISPDQISKTIETLSKNEAIKEMGSAMEFA